MNKFKVGDTLIHLNTKRTVVVVERIVSFDKLHEICSENKVSFQFVGSPEYYNNLFPYSWCNNDQVRKLTKLDKVLK